MRDDGPRALVYRPGSLGDTLVAMPAIQEIRRQYPAHRLTLLTERQAAGSGRVSAWTILKETGWFEDAHFYTVKPGAADQLRNIALALRFRARGYDDVFALAPPRTHKQLSNDAFIFRRVVGATNYHAADREWTGSDTESPVEHEGLRLLRIVSRQAGVDTLDRFRLSVPKPDQEGATLLAKDLGLRPDQVLVGIGPGSGRPTTAWPAERFAAVGHALLERFPNVVLLAIGGSHERELCAGLCAAWGPRSHNLAGRLGVFGSAAVLARCATFIGNDSGPVHLAALVGVPCVAIFSARNALGHWEPLGRGHVVLEERPECAGCMLDECVHEAYKCLTRIEVGAVVRGAVSLVEARSAACLAV
ncbi:MAG: glycosyltransferase family 9 protein [Acidobacteriota bacterium]|nr:glycosyltransferase family 9 protein [Acidobacteriota bacterium]